MSEERPQLLLSALAEKKLDAEDCAHACGVDVQSVYAWNRGDRCPTKAHAAILAKLIGIEEVCKLLNWHARQPSGPGKGRVETGRPLAKSLHSVDRALRARGQHELAQSLREALRT